MSNKYYLELSILSTVLFSHHSCNNEDYFNEYELDPEWFDTPFHKEVVNAIGYNKSQNMPTQEEFIANLLTKYNKMYPELWYMILNANPFSKGFFDQYIENIKKTSIAKLREI